MITTSRRLARSGERCRRKGMSASQSPRQESGAVVSALLIVLPPIFVSLALVLVAVPVAWIGKQIWPPKERRPVCVERSVDDGDRPVPPPPLKCDPAAEKEK